MSDVLEITSSLDIEELLTTLDVEKAFDSINNSFLMCPLKTIGFGNNFRKWIQILIKILESWVINDSKTTPYFKLERGTIQGDPILKYIFIIALKAAFFN